jgi:hypothetical protein
VLHINFKFAATTLEKSLPTEFITQCIRNDCDQISQYDNAKHKQFPVHIHQTKKWLLPTD